MSELNIKRKRMDAMRGKNAEETRHLKELELKKRREELESVTDAERVKDLALDEIFMVLTRAGAAGFTPMLMNSIEGVVEKVMDRKLQEFEERIDDKLRLVASGIGRGLLSNMEQQFEDIKSDIVESEEVEVINDENDPKDMISVDDLPDDPDEKPTEMRPKRKIIPWTIEEDEELARRVIHRGGMSKSDVFRQFEEDYPHRTVQACGFRWNKTLKPQYQLELVHS